MWRNPVWYYAPVCEFHNTQCEDRAATRPVCEFHNTQCEDGAATRRIVINHYSASIRKRPVCPRISGNVPSRLSPNFPGFHRISRIFSEQSSEPLLLANIHGLEVPKKNSHGCYVCRVPEKYS